MRYRINRSLFTVEEDGILMIFNGGDSKLYTFNESASFILSAIEKKQSKGRVLSSMIKYYGISSERADDSYEKFVKQLERENILISENH